MAFKQQEKKAEAMRTLAKTPEELMYWAGFLRGLLRAHHGERFGTFEEHEAWLSQEDSPDPLQAACGRGYRKGLAALKTRS